MLKKHNRLYVYFSTCISCFLNATGLAILMGTGFKSQLNIKEIIVQVFIICIAMTIMLFTRWTAIAGTVVGLSVIMYCVSQLKIGEAGDVASFFNWLITQMPQDSPWYSPKAVDIVHTLINIGICSLLFFVGRTPYRSRLTVLISIALIFLVYITGTTQYNRIIILLIFSGVFSLCAVDKFEHRKHLGSNKNFTVLGKRWIVPAASIILCLLISGSTLIALDNNKKYDFRNRTCSEIAADVQSLTGIYTKEQRDLNISLYDLGLQGNEKCIGGDLPQRDHLLLATTDLNQSYNVKVTAFDKFTGKNWETSFQDNYRINGPFEEKQNQYLANNSFNRSKSLLGLKSFVSRKKVKVVLNVDTVFLFTIGQTYRFTEKSQSINPNFFNSTGQLFSYYGQENGYSYSLDTLNFNINSALSKKYVSLVNELIVKKDPIYTKSFVAHYTKCPIKFDGDMEALIKKIGIKSKNNYDIARKITGFFSKENGFTYATEGLVFDESSNVVSEIFKTKKGHCVYYSSTAIAILRHLKVPCRLAAGYRTIKLADNVQIVDSYYPYCWVECYFPNLGWIGFDPSPENEIRFDVELSSFLNETSKTKEEFKALEGDERTANRPKSGKINFGIVLILLVLALLYLIARGIWANRLYTYKFVSRRFDTTQKQCEYYLKDIERQLSALGFGGHIEKTLREQSAEIYDILKEKDRILLDMAVEICEALCYGGVIPNEEEMIQVSKAHVMLENTLKSQINPIIYILKRRIFLPVL